MKDNDKVVSIDAKQHLNYRINYENGKLQLQLMDLNQQDERVKLMTRASKEIESYYKSNYLRYKDMVLIFQVVDKLRDYEYAIWCGDPQPLAEIVECIKSLENITDIS